MIEELKKMFIAEAEDWLTKTEENLLNLEKNPDNAEIIYEIFRALHSIKGAAGMYAFENITKLTHNFENIFAQIRDNKLQISQQIITLSLKAIDLLRYMLHNEDSAPDNFYNILQQAQQITSQLPSANSNPQKNSTSQTSPKALDNGQLSTFYVLFQPDKDIFERGVNLDSIIAALENNSKCKITPFLNQDPDKFNYLWEIIIAEKDKKKLINDIFIFVQDEIRIQKICNNNLLDDPKFLDFLSTLGKSNVYSQQRFEKIKQFISENYKKDQVSQQTKTSKKQSQPQISSTSFAHKTEIVKVKSGKLDLLLDLISELIIANNNLLTISQKIQDKELLAITEKITQIISALKENSLEIRLVPFKTIVPGLNRMVRDLSSKLNKQINFIVEGTEIEIDKTILDKLYTPLIHIIRNSIDHGIEPPDLRKEKGKNPTGTIKLSVIYSNNNIIIQIQDDGRGIDLDQIRQKAQQRGLIKTGQNLSKKDLYNLLFLHGFSTANNITEISGRGVGLDAVRKIIIDLRGVIDIDSEPGLGTVTTIRLPNTLSIIDTLHVKTGGINFLIPTFYIIDTFELKQSYIYTKTGMHFSYKQKLIPFLDLRQIFDLKPIDNNIRQSVIVIEYNNRRAALVFEEILGINSSVIKSFNGIMQGIDYFLGSSILGDGQLALILDPYKLLLHLSNEN